MYLPNLHPDFRFVPLGRTEEGVAYAFEAKRAALGPHIAQRWDWDETFQSDLHRLRYNEKPLIAICRSAENLGTLSFQRNSDNIRFGEFYLFPQYQDRGIGSAILEHCLAVADRIGLPVELEYLHWNRVGQLYRRYGFEEIARSEIHVFMRRKADSP